MDLSYDVKHVDIIYLSHLIYVYEYEYEVSFIKIIEATDVFVINDVQDKTMLTLITCAEAGSKRLAVQTTLTTNILLEESTL